MTETTTPSLAKRLLATMKVFGQSYIDPRTPDSVKLCVEPTTDRLRVLCTVGELRALQKIYAELEDAQAADALTVAGDGYVLVPRQCNFDFGSILDQKMGPDSTWGAIIAAVAQSAEASGLNPDQVSVRPGPAAPSPPASVNARLLEAAKAVRDDLLTRAEFLGKDSVPVGATCWRNLTEAIAAASSPPDPATCKDGGQVQAEDPSWLDDIEKRANAATEGPWRVENLEPGTLGFDWIRTQKVDRVADCNNAVGWDENLHAYCRSVETEEKSANADFIAHARSDIPKLISTLRARSVPVVTEERIEAAAMAIYAKRPFVMSVGENIDGDLIGRSFDWKSAPAYRQNEAREFAKAVLQASLAPQEKRVSGHAGRDEWQPIETAPKDGTWVLLWSHDAADEKNPFIGQWREYDKDPDGGAWWENNDNHFCIDADPTFWQPLPPPPRSTPDAQGET